MRERQLIAIAWPRATPDVTVIARAADPARRRRLLELLVDLLDKPTDSGRASER